MSAQRNTAIICPVCSLWSKRNDRKTRRVPKCKPKCRNIHHSGQIPFFSDGNPLLEVFVKKEPKQSPTETERQAGRLLSGEGGGTTTEKKIPGISVRSWKDFLIPVTATDWTTALWWLPSQRCSSSHAVYRLGAVELSRQEVAGS